MGAVPTTIPSFKLNAPNTIPNIYHSGPLSIKQKSIDSMMDTWKEYDDVTMPTDYTFCGKYPIDLGIRRSAQITVYFDNEGNLKPLVPTQAQGK